MKKLLLISLLFLSIIVPNSAFAGGFVSSEGSAFLKLALQSWFADKIFAGINDISGMQREGDHLPFDSKVGGEFRSSHLSLSGSYVPISKVELNLFIPMIQQSTFTDDKFSSDSTGIGDLYLGMRYQVLSFQKIGTTLGVKGKVPLESVNEDQREIPLSTGQFDVAIEQSTSWAVKPAFHLNLRTLYRSRFSATGEGRNYDYQDEVELGVEMAGSPVPTLWLKLGGKSLWAIGGTPNSNSPDFENQYDRIHELYLGAYWNVGRFLPSAKGLAIDALYTVPMAGEAYPRGITWNIGLAYAF